MKEEWICTDPDTMQFGRQVGEREYEFKEDCEWSDSGTVSASIFLGDYSDKEIEWYISPYGYTIEGLKKDDPESAEWIMAECIFEQTITDYIE